jgi:hypothetical protein
MGIKMISTNKRVDIKVDNIPSTYKREAEQINSIIEKASSFSSRDTSIETEMDNLVTDMFDKFGYDIIKRVSNPYGKEYNLKAQDSKSVLTLNKIEEIVEKLGFTVEEAKTVNREINIFVPSAWRYLPFEHSTNKQNSELIMILYIDSSNVTTHFEVCSSNKEHLERISNIVIPDSIDFNSNTLTYNSKAIEPVFQAVKHESITHSVYERTLNSFPLFEWSPSDDQQYVILERENKDDIRSPFIVHESESTTPSCSSGTDNYRKVFVETINSHMDVNSSIEVKTCNSEKCQLSREVEDFLRS